jgi:hypothetical protein
VGPYKVSHTLPTSDESALPPDTWNPLARGSHRRYALPTITLNILSRGVTVQRWTMSRVLALVGRSDTCKVRLHGEGVSRNHCALVCTPLGVWVIDLQRRHGLMVNGTHLGHALLEDGDQIEVGGFTLAIEYVAPPTPPTDNATPQASALVALPGAGIAPGSALARAPGDSMSQELVAGLLRQFGEMQQQMFEQSMTMMFQLFRTMHLEHVGTLRQEMTRLEELNRELNALSSEQAKGTRSVIPPPTTKATTPSAPASAASKPVPEKPTLGLRPPSTDNNPDLHIWLCQRMEAIQQERRGLWDRIIGIVGKKD